MSSKAKRPIRMAVIGAGSRGTNAYAPFALKAPEDLVIVAVAEPDDFRRRQFAEKYSLPDSSRFSSAERMLDSTEADAVLIASPDTAHFAHIMAALDRDLNILSEKPVSSSAAELKIIGRRLEECRSLFMICHVLRYTPFFRTIKGLLDAGAIGRLMAVQHNEHVGHFHMAHSYVRGHWRRADVSSPMILAKCCHDMDILNWLIDSNCVRLSSFGSLGHFTEEQAPPGSLARCLDGCSVESTCPYSALRYTRDAKQDAMIYDFAGMVRLAAGGATIDDALRDGPYGRCVYRCDNDVVDHQTVALEYGNGTTVAFSMNAFTDRCTRTIKLMGTHGEIRGSMKAGLLEVTDFVRSRTRAIPLGRIESGHSGGDEGLIRAFIELVREPDLEAMRKANRQGLAGHFMALAAEESRLSGEVHSMTPSI